MGFSDTDFSILLVEDDVDDLLLFTKSLEHNPRFPALIDTAHSADEALEKMKARQYHLILVDTHLDDDSGLHLLDAARAAQIEMPFILLTPVRDDRLVREAMKRGMADVIVKSESHFKQLAEKLRESYDKYCQANQAPAEIVEIIKSPEEEFSALVQKLDQLSEVTIKDELTGVFSHGYMHERIVREFSRASRYGYPISCLMLDVDHFKDINEKQGYRAGDLLLKESAQMLFDSCRLSDVIARYGGTEFLVLLPHVSYQGALQLAKRLRIRFTEHSFLKEQNENIKVTVSIGVSSFPEDAMTRRSDLITFARRALLNAKAAGRNRCLLFRDLQPVGDSAMPKLEISEEKIGDFQRRIAEVTENARRDYLKVSRELLFALESKDRFTAGHGATTAKYAKQIALAMELVPEEVEIVENGALLHDIGKICVPDVILLKTGKLTFNEFEIMKQHTYYGYKIIKPIKFLREEALIVLHHHEWFNGEGYPCHLKGEEIPLGARIVSVVDAYDTMRSAGGRYKKTITVEEAVNELVQCAGLQFDPRIVKVFIDVLKARKELSEATYNKEHLERAIAETSPNKSVA